MLSFRQELLCECVPEVSELLQLHYQELTLNKERIKLAPLWTRYAALEQAGAFAICTARDQGRLVGYGAFFIQQHIHYEETTVAVNDVLYLHPDFRQGLAGIRLIRFCEARMKALGAHKITWHAKHGTALAPILARLGYWNEEVVMGKLFP